MTAYIESAILFIKKRTGVGGGDFLLHIGKRRDQERTQQASRIRTLSWEKGKKRNLGP